MNEEILIPLAMFGSVVLGVYFYLSHRHKSLLVTQETLRKMIDSEHVLTPEMIQSIGIKGGSASLKPEPMRDMRRALLFIGFGIATALFSRFLPDVEAGNVFTGLSFFPTFIGLGYLAAHYLAKGQDKLR